MVAQNVIDTIIFAKDLDTQNQMKIYSIIIFLILAVVFLYIDQIYLKKDNRASMKILSVGLKSFYWIFFIYVPTLIWNLSVYTDVGFLMYIQTLFYVVGAVLMIIVLALYLLERMFKDFLGWEITMEGVKINVDKFYRK